VVAPRGSLKSTIGTKLSSIWIALRQYYLFDNDGITILLAGNTHTNTKKKLNGIRGVFDNKEIFKAMFPEILPRKGIQGDKWSDIEACVRRKSSPDESTFEIGSLRTKLTGRHYHVIVEDDTMAPEVSDMEEDLVVPSANTIQAAIGFHQSSKSLFVPRGFRLSLVISTRWAMEDLIHRVVEREGYKVFDVPAIVNGVYTFPTLYDKEALDDVRDVIGDYMFSCLYLNKPIDDTLRTFRQSDMQWVKQTAIPPGGVISVAVDPAISQKEDACESAITVNHHIEMNGIQFEYWRYAYHGRLTPFDLAEKILQIADRFDRIAPVTTLILEQVAYQEALKYIIQNMYDERRAAGKKCYKIVDAKRGNKQVRIEGLQPGFQSSRIYFVEGTLDDATESQLLQYPNGKLRDIIDCWSMHRHVWKGDARVDEKQKIVIESYTFDDAVKEILKRHEQPEVWVDRCYTQGDWYEG